MAGKESIGETVVARSAGVKSVVVAVPIIKDGQVVGALGASVFLEDLSERLSRELALTGGRTFYAINTAGEVALHSDVSKILAPNPSLPRDVVWQTSKLTGWRFALVQADADAR